MAAPAVSPERIASIAGYGMRTAVDAYVFRPTTIEEIRDAFDIARQSGRKVVLRGAGRSYGDANLCPESIVVDICRMRRVLAWDKHTGIIDCEAGVTLEQLWRTTLEDGYWPPIVSGTMYPTLAGALAMNIHGKNNFCAGTLGEHVLEIDVLFTTGELRTIPFDDPLFYAVISGAGLLGAITRVKLQMKPIDSGDLHVLSWSCANWQEQFDTLESFERDSDYMVSWVDCFGRGKHAGRGQIHVAWYAHEKRAYSSSLSEQHQDLPDTILGFWPKSTVWRVLKLLNNRAGMRTVNWARHNASRILGHGKTHDQSLVGFSFLLDYVPNWRNAYLPGGFIQYQSFVPKQHARQVFAEQVAIQQDSKLESFLGVLKRHRPDSKQPFLFSHAVDGYSLALDFKVTDRNWSRLEKVCHRMNDLVLQAGGRFYFAKDSTLRPGDVRAYLGAEALARYRSLKLELDPDHLLTSSLALRLELERDA